MTLAVHLTSMRPDRWGWAEADIWLFAIQHAAGVRIRWSRRDLCEDAMLRRLSQGLEARARFVQSIVMSM